MTGHVFRATILDGYISRPDGDIEWLLSRDDSSEDHGYNDFIENIDGIIMGRGSYEKIATFDPWPYTRPVVVLTKKLAATSVPEHLKGKVRFLDVSPREAMTMLADEGWSRVYVDGGRIIQSFLREGLISDMVITQVPVLIGEGRTLFGPLEKDISLTHLSTKAFPSGLVQTKYSLNK